MEILSDIPVNLEPAQVLERIQVRKDKHHIGDIIRELLTITHPLTHPKAVYEVGYIDHKNHETVTINGVCFTSRLLRVNLDKVERVFPYVVTCGRELNEVTTPPGDFMRSYCLDAIKETALRAAFKHLREHLTAKYHLGRLSTMTPGSLNSWPIDQQPALFRLIGDVTNLIGVRLTSAYLMVPVKSVSGMFFPTEINFESCQLCPREGCPSRRAAYDADLTLKYR